MIKRGEETIRTKKEALRDARATISWLEHDYDKPVKAKEYKDEIKNVDDLFDFYKLCTSYDVNIRWLDFKQRWSGLDDSERNQIYNYIGMFRERQQRNITICQMRLVEGLVKTLTNHETVVEKMIQFTNDDVPNFLKRLRRAERYALEHPSTLKYMTSTA